MFGMLASACTGDVATTRMMMDGVRALLAPSPQATP
jgi:hypothetical protein